jgi:hypothetical protein
MAKTEAEWRKLVDDWKKVVNEPKNLGLRAGGTGISAKVLAVADHEGAVALAAKGRNLSIAQSYADLSGALTEAINLCGKTTEKHKKLFTSACKWLDEHIKAPAVHRKTELNGELAELRKHVQTAVGVPLQTLTNAKTTEEFAHDWTVFVAEFESHAKNFPHLKPYLAKAKAKAAPEGNLTTVKPEYLKLARECHGATVLMA